LDDEELTVVHRPTGRAYELTISGIGDNFQLHTMLADTLMGDEAAGWIPGQRPSAEQVAAATTGYLLPQGGMRGSFTLVTADGDLLWNEGHPADIPMAGGGRTVVLDSGPHISFWDAGRAYPLVVPQMRKKQ
jgi:hypothetical protein